MGLSRHFTVLPYFASVHGRNREKHREQIAHEKVRFHLAAKPGRDLAQEWPTRPEAGGCLTAQRERATRP